ncbi:enoyl-CoA hydratase/isomerase family protein [bacterium]|nr:enoyl-CoA hydratase/isomerase family protein [bacterium]
MADFTRFRWSAEEGVATITFARPERLNALDDVALDELARACARAAADDSVRAILLTGEGRGFCAGADVKFMMERAIAGIDEPVGALFRSGATRLHAAVAELRRTPKPVVAAVNGPAAGAGVGLALAADIVWAARDATFTLAYTQIGLAPDGATTYFLTRLVGEKRALELFFLGETLTADEAARLGVVTRVFASQDELAREARALALRLAKGPTVAFGLAKACVVDSLREGLESQMEKERQAIARSAVTEDFMEGISAFVQKRPAEFKGR